MSGENGKSKKKFGIETSGEAMLRKV